MSSRLELPKNKTLLQGHEKKYNLLSECAATKKSEQNKEPWNTPLSKMPIF
jgi:hypothetical protein